jgi:carbon-monoxide dehydrogenase medium subunit
LIDLRVHQPETVDEALELLSELGDDAAVISGGTAMVLMLKTGLIAPEAMVSLGRIRGMSEIVMDDGHLKMGALTTLRAAEKSPLVNNALPVLSETFGKVANVRVRNVATVGGNLAEADYASDPPATLLALRGSVVARSKRGERLIPLTDFFHDFYETALEPDELIIEVRVPQLDSTAGASYLKYVTRSTEDRPCVGVAAVVDLDNDNVCTLLRVVVGAVAATPQEVGAAEDLAVGRALDDVLIDEIADAYSESIDPIDDLRGSKWYRRKMIRVFVKRAIQEAISVRSVR